MNRIPDLSETLWPIFDYEVSRGNQIVRIDKPAGSSCPLAVIFSMSLDIQGYIAAHGLPNGVNTWENRDSHYPLEKGYFCEHTRHALAGPFRTRR
jgi:hypothetical protein